MRPVYHVKSGPWTLNKLWEPLIWNCMWMLLVPWVWKKNLPWNFDLLSLILIRSIWNFNRAPETWVLGFGEVLVSKESFSFECGPKNEKKCSWKQKKLQTLLFTMFQTQPKTNSHPRKQLMWYCDIFYFSSKLPDELMRYNVMCML